MENRLKEMLQVTTNQLCDIYNSYLYEGYITPKYKQRLRNIRILNTYNLKDSKDSELKNDILSLNKYLNEVYSRVDDTVDQDILIIYLIGKCYDLLKKYSISFNYRGRYIKLNPQTLTELLIKFDSEIINEFNESLINKEAIDDYNDNTVISLADLI